MKVCHLSSVHQRNDTRVFFKECVTLQKNGYDTHLVIADGLGDETKYDVKIIDVGKPTNRFSRIFITTIKVFLKAKKLDVDIYHFHDPELAPICLLFRLLGKPVIFDVHENIGEQLKDKKWLSPVFANFFSFLFSFLNTIFTKSFSVIIAENSYSTIYKNQNSKHKFEVVLNFPELQLLEQFKNLNRAGNEFFYIGVISNDRGLDTILDSLNILESKNYDFKMHFIGRVFDEIDWAKYSRIKEKIIFYGRMNLDEGYAISSKCIAGLAVLKPIGNYVGSYPTKVFEYMAIGLPTITSNFALYKEIVEDNKVGWCVDPYSSISLAEIMMSILDAISLNKISESAIVAAEKYSWESESKKMLKMYKNILSN
ncbi:glycosyltransferase [Flavobacteriales bacterium]|nr:glycosyltransferase [Flavobacteriales bacterium]|tara:strand:- start:5538 stop:6644 length:1107 start_codon:yes stop_codon:yes gene_type:complete